MSSLHHRLTRIEHSLSRGFAPRGVCRDCGWPGPDSREQAGATAADQETLRALYTIAQARRRLASAACRAGSCPRCGWPTDDDHAAMLTFLSDPELEAAGTVHSRMCGERWPTTAAESEEEIRRLRALLGRPDP